MIVWSKKLFNTFCDEAMLSDIEIAILETRIKGCSITQQSLQFGMSEASICRIIKRLKMKYDKLSEQYPDIYPTRK